MHPEALKSRLGARVKNAGLDFSFDDDSVTLARCLIDNAPAEWEDFSKAFGMRFDYESGQFLDLKELAGLVARAELSGDPDLVRRAEKILDLLRPPGP